MARTIYFIWCWWTEIFTALKQLNNPGESGKVSIIESVFWNMHLICRYFIANWGGGVRNGNKTIGLVNGTPWRSPDCVRIERMFKILAMWYLILVHEGCWGNDDIALTDDGTAANKAQTKRNKYVLLVSMHIIFWDGIHFILLLQITKTSQWNTQAWEERSNLHYLLNHSQLNRADNELELFWKTVMCNDWKKGAWNVWTSNYLFLFSSW